MKDSGERTDEKRLTTDELATAARRREHGTEAIAHPAEDRDREGVREPSTRESELSPLFSNEEERDFRNRWKDIQTGFVDEPRQSVEQADALIAKLLQRLAESFSEQRSHLEQQWKRHKERGEKETRPDTNGEAGR